MGKKTKALGFIETAWNNSKQLLLAEVSLILLAIISISIIAPDPSIQSASNYLLALTLWAAIFFVGERIPKLNHLFETVGWGKSTSNAMIAGAIGLVLAFIIAGSGQSIIPLTILSPGVSTVLFVGFFAFVVEETFWRGSFLPTCAKILRDFRFPFANETAIVAQAIGFGVSHATVAGVLLGAGSLGALSPYILFGLIAGIGNGLFQSSAFSYSLHAGNNLLWLYSTGVI